MLKSAYRIASGLVASTVLLALVGYASNQAVGMFSVVMATVFVLMAGFYFLFGSKSGFFDVIFANAITLYLCFFTFFVESLFAGVSRAVLPVGFILPPAAFLAGVISRHREIQNILAIGKVESDAEFARSFLWLLPIVTIGFIVFVLHQRVDLDSPDLNYVFVGEMGLIGCVVYMASKDFALMLMDTGIIFRDFFASNAHLMKPIFAFFTLYSMNIVVFASIYRIIDYVSIAQPFIVRGVARNLSFVESIYFSLVTVSTLGYGDISPVTNAVRFIVGIQTLMGTILFFFGVHAILAHQKGGRKK